MLLLSGLGLFFSAILLTYNKGYKTANLYLGLFLFFLNYLTLYHYLIIFNDSQDILAVLLCIPIRGSAYLVGPLAYLYVKSIIQDNVQFNKYDALHFIMFGIIFIGSLPYNLTSWFVKYQAANDIINHSWNSLNYPDINKFISSRINYALKGIHIFLYLIGIWTIIIKYEVKKSTLGKRVKQQKKINHWLIFFAVIVTCLFVIISIKFVTYLGVEDKFTLQFEGKILFAIVFMGCLVLILGLILFPQILYGMPVEKLRLEDDNKIEPKALLSSEAENDSFHEDYIDEIRLLLENWKKGNKFLNIDSSIYKLAEEINLPIHHVTYFFNQINNEKYIDWRNRLRVEYAISLIDNQKNFDKTIVVLGKECGFRSYATFIHCFKQVTGKLPKEYIKESKQKLIL
jgi:AraC-like DNA-binding protein/nitrate reductase NapE component